MCVCGFRIKSFEETIDPQGEGGGGMVSVVRGALGTATNFLSETSSLH